MPLMCSPEGCLTARHDPLTGLSNRSRFVDRVDESLGRMARDGGDRCAVLFVDVDRFKLVNDGLGHDAGDALLLAVAGRLAAALGPADTAARLCGDEFAVLVETVEDELAALAVAERVQRALDAPFDIDGHRLFVSAGIGVALGAPGLSAAELVGDADVAMDCAKRRGPGRSAAFHPRMRRRAAQRLARESELRQVVLGAELDVHYQPIVSLDTGAICGLEALARWPGHRHPVPPSEFIPIAEDTGIIGALGRHVLTEALGQLADWRADGLVGDDVCMSVNVSGRQLDDPTLAEQVLVAIEQAALPPRALKLEITESTLIADVDGPERMFSDVCAGGVGLHLDDFGTGYSSLAALHRFPVDAVKVDRGFVAGLEEAASGGEVIIASTVAMAHSLGLPVIAEGIEEPEQLRRLQALGCDFGQGHLFSPALGADEIRALLREWRGIGLAVGGRTPCPA